tara:strand:+ start:2740 stop:3717 length:978 start_codon:yes stop_codon:yes gene_type:complete
MFCDTKVNSISYLKEEKAIDETRIILDENLFNEGNEYLTSIANEKYGMDTGGKMLFNAETTTYKEMSSNYAAARDAKVTRAVPVESFFKELDLIVDEYDIIEEDAIAIVADRVSEPIVVNKGNKYKGSNVRHYTTSKPYSSKVNIQTRMSNKGFLNQNKDKNLYNRLVSEYQIRSGKTFDINNNTKSGAVSQLGFYNFVASKGLLGVELVDSRGDIHMVKFEPQTTIEFSDTEINTDTFTEEFTGEEIPVDAPTKRSVLEDMNWFNQSELDDLYRTYSAAEINQFMEDNVTDAKKVFTDLLYPNEFKNDIFVSDRDVNYQIKKCK